MSVQEVIGEIRKACNDAVAQIKYLSDFVDHAESSRWEATDPDYTYI